MLYLLVNRHYKGVKSPAEYRDLIERKPEKELSPKEVKEQLLRKLEGGS